MIHLVAPLDGKVIGNAEGQENAWLLCRRCGLAPYPITDASVVDLMDSEGGTKIWTVRSEHIKYPFNRSAFENRKRDSIAE